MIFYELREEIKTNIFTFLDVAKLFPDNSPQSIRVQLSRFARKGFIKKIKRGLYCFTINEIDQLELSSFLYSPSYISLETALNYHGLIPDIPQLITAITPTTTKKIRNGFGVFYYTKIDSKLFFGFTKVKSPDSNTYFEIAQKEKALLDYIYIRKVKTLSGLRVNSKNLNLKIVAKYKKSFPIWVQKVKIT